MNYKTTKVQQCPKLQFCGENRHTSHAGRSARWSISYGEGMEISSQTIYAFTLGPSHTTSSNRLEIGKYHLHKVIHCCTVLLKVAVLCDDLRCLGQGLGWKGSPRRRGYMYTYSKFSSLHRKQHNIVKQLYSN